MPKGTEPSGRARLLTASLGTGPALSLLCHVDWNGEEFALCRQRTQSAAAGCCARFPRPVPVQCGSLSLPPRVGVRVERDHIRSEAPSSVGHRLRAVVTSTVTVLPALLPLAVTLAKLDTTLLLTSASSSHGFTPFSIPKQPIL